MNIIEKWALKREKELNEEFQKCKKLWDSFGRKENPKSKGIVRFIRDK